MIAVPMAATPFLDQRLAWGLLAGFALLWILLGAYWSRQAVGTSGYLFAGRNVGLALVTATLMATWVTGNTVLAAPEQAYTLGLWGMVGYAFAGFGLLLFAPMSVRIRTLMPHGFTSGDFILRRFGRPAWAVFWLISAVYFTGWLATQGMGAGLLLQTLSGIDYHVGMLVVIGVTTIYTVMGGMRAVIGMDFVQAMIIMVGLVVVAIMVYARFGVTEIYSGLQTSEVKPLNLLLPAGLLYAWNTGLFSMGEVSHSNVWWMRAYASRPRVNFRGFILSGVMWMTVPLATGAIALAALALPGEFQVDQVNMVFPVVASTMLGTVGAVLVFLIVFAALASTLSGLLTATSTLITQDIYRQFINPQASDEVLRRVARGVIVALAVATVVVAWGNISTMYTVLLFTGAMVGSTVWPVIYGLYVTDANRTAACAAMVLGSISGLLFFFLASPFAAALIGFVVSAAVIIIGTWIRPEPFEWRSLREAGLRVGDSDVATQEM